MTYVLTAADRATLKRAARLIEKAALALGSTDVAAQAKRTDWKTWTVSDGAALHDAKTASEHIDSAFWTLEWMVAE